MFSKVAKRGIKKLTSDSNSEGSDYFWDDRKMSKIRI